MPVLHYLKFTVPYPSLHVPNTLLWPSSALLEHPHCQINMFQANYWESATKKIYPSAFNSSRDHPFGASYISLNVRKVSHFCNCYASESCVDLYEMQTPDEDAQIDLCRRSLESIGDKYSKELERRKKIGLANKGRVPWNKGVKHTAETRARIKQKTIEALKHPKVRMRMAAHPRLHSEESKAKIGSAVRQVWQKRLRWKQSGENFILSWSQSIAKAAKDGWSDQQELAWDSYENMIKEMAIQQHQLAADMAKAKEMAKIMRERKALERAEKIALAKAQKMERLAQKKKEREEKASVRRVTKRKRGRKSEKDGKSSDSEGLKLRQRLTKIHKKKAVNVRVTIRDNPVKSHSPAWEKFDMDLVKKEKSQKEVSLAEQIQAIKNKRMQSSTQEVLVASSAACQFSMRSGN